MLSWELLSQRSIGSPLRRCRSGSLGRHINEDSE